MLTRHNLSSFILILVALFVVIQTAWIADDAYVTFRVVDNFTHGYGIRWNLIERAQVFTHPLWFFLVSATYLFTHEMYYSVLCLSMGLSVIAYLVIPLSVFRSLQSRFLWFACVLSSKVVIDFATSGLETPLSLLLVSVIMATLVAQRGGAGDKLGVFACGLVCFNRLDTVLLIAPLLGLFMWSNRRRKEVWSWIVLAFLPLGLWTLFSVWYFGYPFPITALAKIDLDISTWQRIEKGLAYTFLWMRNDFASFALLVFGLTGLVISRSVWCVAWAMGIGLSCFYVLWVGGDFMLGRFYTLPVFASLYGIVMLSTRAALRPAVMGAIVLVVGGLGERAPLRAATGLDDVTYKVEGADGILVDERLYYFKHAGLIHRVSATDKELSIPHTKCSEEETRVITSGNVGYLGWNSCRTRIIVDPTAITSPFLARLRPEPGYTRAGHLYRRVPDGYLDALETGARLKDPNLQKCYEVTQFITDGPLWSASRFREAIKMAFGLYRHLCVPAESSDDSRP